MQKREPLRWMSPGSQRLRWVRLAEGFDKGQFAQHVGVGITAYSQYDNGIRLSLDAAIKIADKVPGLTVDYLGSRLIRSTIQELRRGRQRPGSCERACRSGLRYA